MRQQTVTLAVTYDDTLKSSPSRWLWPEILGEQVTLVRSRPPGPAPWHNCGICDGPLVFVGLGGDYPAWRCARCGWWHTAKDCCDFKDSHNIIMAAAGLLSEEGENSEYDRALVEVTCTLMGLSVEENRKRVEQILRRAKS